MSEWFVYILESDTKKPFYTGMTNNPTKRLATHNAGKGAKFTRSGRPWKIVYLEEVDSKSEALQRELAVKRLSRKQKEELVNGHT